jgi:hypothetical protein
MNKKKKKDMGVECEKDPKTGEHDPFLGALQVGLYR